MCTTGFFIVVAWYFNSCNIPRRPKVHYLAWDYFSQKQQYIITPTLNQQQPQKPQNAPNIIYLTYIQIKREEKPCEIYGFFEGKNLTFCRVFPCVNSELERLFNYLLFHSTHMRILCERDVLWDASVYCRHAPPKYYTLFGLIEYSTHIEPKAIIAKWCIWQTAIHPQ